MSSQRRLVRATPQLFADLDRLAGLGVIDIDDDPTELLVSSSQGPRIWFQAVPEPKTTKDRVHLDLQAMDPARELGRLVSLGARVLDDRADEGITVMQDPEGIEFCLIG